MKVVMTPETLSRLSSLLDEALDLDEPAREAWLATLPDNVAELGPTLRKLLARQASKETADLLERGPSFTLPVEGDSAATAFHPGDTVGPYRLLRALGHGGMGEVWQAERADGTLKRKVALKLPHVTWAPGLAERFAREREILASLEHPHIARLYDAGLDPHGRPYMALEYVEGLPIDEFCKKRALPVEGKLRLLLQVADAVAFAHSRLVIHRDLKPGNILVTDDGQVRLLDFGIAKLMEGEATRETALTRVGGRALTLDYASPEQIRGEPIGTSSDVYSLAVVAFELLAGERPYRLKRGSAAELEEAIVGQDLPLASSLVQGAEIKKALRGDVDAILNKALKKTVAERYPTVDALAQDWRRHLNGERVFARPDTLVYRLNRLFQQHRVPIVASAITVVAFGLALGVGATALVIFVLLLGLGAAVWQAKRANEQARIAEAQAHMALQESHRAQAVQGFLVDLFSANASRQKDPAKARATTARELLDLGAERLAISLKDAPEARAEILMTLGEMYYQLELEERAADLDGQRVDLLRQLVGNKDVRLADALIKLAGSLHATAHRERILPALEEAKSILDRMGDRSSPLRGELLVRLTQRYFNVSLARAKAYADEAVTVLRAQAEVDGDMLSTAFILGARVCIGIGELAAARDQLSGAIAEILKLSNTPHFDLMNARFLLADVLAQQQQFEPALKLAREAAERGAAALGHDAPGVIMVHARWGTLLHNQGQREKARELQQCALDAILKIKGPDDTLYTPIARVELSRTLLAEGRLADSLRHSEATVAVYREHYSGSPILAAALRTHAALCTALGRYSEARQLVQEALEMLQHASGGAMLPWRFNRLVLDEARLDLAEGRPDAALSTLARFTPWPDSESPPPRPDDVERDTLAALAHMQRGDVSTAMRHAQLAGEAMVQVSARGRQPGLEAEALLVRGKALLDAGEPAAACTPLERAVALRREFDDRISPWLAQAEAVHGRCLLLLGERNAASQAAGRAQEIVAANSSLGDPFTKPLQDLMRALDP
jgi:serine/threonine-protein kinase